ncbi:hypothetical protein O0L34_g9888 [Tuta absoluta]|nr:hypothetical protein O0L34_g9888 [Tuta absoluta]
MSEIVWLHNGLQQKRFSREFVAPPQAGRQALVKEGWPYCPDRLAGQTAGLQARWWGHQGVKVTDFWVSSHARSSDFYASACQAGESALPLLIVRSVAFVLALTIMTWAICEGCNWFWLAFLTNWGLMLVTSMFLSGIVVSTMAFMKKIPDEGDLPWYVSMYWFLHNVAVGMSLLITLLYWVLLFHPEMIHLEGIRLFILDLMTHGVNSILVMVELLASRTPVRLLHIWQPLGVGIWYGLFTLIFFCAGGTDALGNPFIYEILDWRRPGQSSIIVALSAVALIILYCLTYGIAYGRDKLTKVIFRTASVKFAEVFAGVPDVTSTAAFAGVPGVSSSTSFAHTPSFNTSTTSVATTTTNLAVGYVDDFV